MNVNIRPLIICLFGLILVVACKNSSETKKVEAASTEQPSAEITKRLPAQTAADEHPGKAVYTKYCMVCHKADGTGVANMHPPLTPGSWVGKDPAELIAIMMKGLSGRIEVDDEEYNNFMPSHARLTDEEIANVLSYIRSSFGNNFPPVTTEMVAKVRSGR